MPSAIHITMLELTIVRRNLWVAIATGMMVLFSIILAMSGNLSSGAVAGDRLTVTVANLTMLLVYLVPLLALLLSYDAISGEQERGTLALLCCYPISRRNILIGKLIAHVAALAIAMASGLVVAAVLSESQGPVSLDGWMALLRLYASALALGTAFVAIGYIISSGVRSSSAAAAIAIGIWVLFVVLYDLALLGVLVADNGGAFTKEVFPWLLAANPADAFRTFNILGSETLTLASGLVGTSDGPYMALSIASLVGWPVVSLFVAGYALRRREP